MKLEQQVVSLELAQKLKELKVKQESLFYWTYTMNGVDTELTRLSETIDGVIASAFTVAELGEMLPNYFLSYGYYGEWACGELDGMQSNGKRDCKKEPWTYADTEANARAKMLIRLLENNLCKTN